MASNNAGSIGNIRKKFHNTHELISTAYHEAGHTVYGLLHNINIESVLVFADKKTKRINGFTHYHPSDLVQIQDPELLNDRLHAEICLSYAGLVSEKRYFKMISGSDKLPMFLREGSSNDLSEAAGLFEKYNLSEPGHKRYNYKQKLIKQIDLELQENWIAITVIAHALFKKKRLSFIEIKDLLIRKAGNKEFWKKQFKILDQLYGNAEPLDEKNIKSILYQA
jgi:ATP-dependent Zn protease